jgi:hypothetical protein
VGDSYVMYKNIVAVHPLDDLNVEDPPIKYWKIYTPTYEANYEVQPKLPNETNYKYYLIYIND